MDAPKKVVLIRPYFHEVVKQQSYPLGLGYLAAILRKAGYWVRIYDLNAIDVKNREFVKILLKISPDYIGVSCLTYDFLGMIELCNLIKAEESLRLVPLIIGGVHGSSLPEFSLQKTNADFIVIGEGEQTFPELLNAIAQKKSYHEIAGIGFFENSHFIQTKPRELIQNLDDLPFPAWDLLNPKLYKIPHGVFYKKAPIFPIITSRGCPYHCVYCASKNFWKNRIRFRSPKNVVDEIEFLQKTYGAKEIQIWDDNFTLNKHFVYAIARELLQRKIKILFSCPNGVRIDTLNEKMLKVLKGIGFYSLIFAVESGSQKIQTKIEKYLNLSIVPIIISMAKQLGFVTRAFFIIGLPSENLNDIYKTYSLALKLPLDTANFFMFTPLPGSSFFYQWITKHNVNSIKWDYDYFTNPQNMAGFNEISPKMLQKLQRFIYLKFYILRPWKIIRYMLNFKISQVNLILNRITYVLSKKS